MQLQLNMFEITRKCYRDEHSILHANIIFHSFTLQRNGNLMKCHIGRSRQEFPPFLFIFIKMKKPSAWIRITRCQMQNHEHKFSISIDGGKRPIPTSHGQLLFTVSTHTHTATYVQTIERNTFHIFTICRLHLIE